MNKLQKILDTINKTNPRKLRDVESELRDGESDIESMNMNSSPEEEITDTDFEVDGQIHKVPFKTIREYLQTGKVGEPSPVPAFRNRIPLPSIPNTKPPENKDYDASGDDGYYWDDNYNYEYMNPEAEKEKVLGKVRK